MFELIVAEKDLEAVAESMEADSSDMDASETDLGQETRRINGVFCVKDEYFSPKNTQTLERLEKAGIPFYGCQEITEGHSGVMFCSGAGGITYAPCGRNYRMEIGLDERGNPSSDDLRRARRTLHRLKMAREKVFARGF